MIQVCYLMSGPAHLPYLAVSLATLRRWYAGRVVVCAYPESHPAVVRIAADPRCNADARLWHPHNRGKNGQFIEKIRMMSKQIDNTTVYLDADTMISGKLDELVVAAQDHGFAATQFCNWQSNRGSPAGRIRRLLDRQPIDQAAVKKILAEPWPSVNGGVFASHPDSKSWFLNQWHQWTLAVKDIFIADETVLHALVAYQHVYADELRKSGIPAKKCAVMEGGSFNCSPRYQPKNLLDSDVKIWHFHGDSNVRPNKSKKGFDLWWPEYQKCLSENWGYIQEWVGACGNQWITDLEAAQGQNHRPADVVVP